jgi:hypothetical protein
MNNFIPLKKDDWVEQLEKHLTPNDEGYHALNSIMQYGNICTCDAAFMCEHRAKVVIDFIKANIN